MKIFGALGKKKIAVTAAMLMLGLYLIWKPGTPLGDRCYSPNHDYFIQQYQNINLWALAVGFGMPGQVSDNGVGYALLYNKEGRLLNERLVNLQHGPFPRWGDKEVYFLGDDSEEWVLPSSAGRPSHRSRGVSGCY